ncbi:MAG: hypothetical protein Q8K82_02385 [Gemmatimonadaceae bacterium]|nr:hypothetical protein [Gemmatimonadaceae bacterium]
MFSYPGGPEGRYRADSAAAASFTQGEVLGAPVYFGTGRWYEISLGVLPDGRCVVASEDRILWISRASENVSGRLRVFLQGNSVGSKMLVGAVTVTTGVPTRVARMLRIQSQ